MQWIKTLFDNSRFYLLLTSIAVSIAVVSALRLSIPSDQLFLIRSQQVLGLVAIVLLYLAVLLTPLSKLLKNTRWIPLALFARRAIGVSAAYFTILHIIIAVIDQIGGLGNVLLLPDRFRLSFLLGAVAAFILILMAATSFDNVIKKMTFPRWKMLHRFVYLAIVLVVIHVWLIGSHVDELWVRVVGGSALAFLFALEALRLSTDIAKKRKLNAKSRLVIAFGLFAIMLGSLALLPALTENYHNEHEGVSGS